MRDLLRALLTLAVCCAGPAVVSAGPASTNEQRTLLLVAGEPGEEGYATLFNAWAANWKKAAEAAQIRFVSVGLPAAASGAATNEPAGPDAPYGQVKKFLEEEPKEGANEFWIVLIGHGTFNGKDAKFNLSGPDFSAAELAQWLRPFQRPTIVVNSASASAPFINALSSPDRVIVTATRSGYEQNYARLGGYLSEAILDLKTDLDKDGQVSLLEAFIFASKQTLEFYKNEGRLATEHALLDDNGDSFGTPADWFRGVRAHTKPAQGKSIDGLRAHQIHLVRSEAEQKLSPEVRAKRDEIELEISRLRDEKADIPEGEYFARLEGLLLQLARIYGVDAPAPAQNSSASNPRRNAGFE